VPSEVVKLNKEVILEEIHELEKRVKEENLYSIDEIMNRLAVDIYLYERDIESKMKGGGI